MKPQSVAIQVKATEHYFPGVLFVMLYKMVLTFESPQATILDFMRIYRCLVISHKISSASRQKRKPYDLMKSKLVVRKKTKS